MLTFIQNEDYRLRYAVSEWSKIEYELTRERGLWGPETPSPLDKWMLDTVEGRCYLSCDDVLIIFLVQ